MSDSTEAVRKAAPQRVAAVMALDASPVQWKPQELAAIFRHQMTAPLLVDLGAMDPALAGQFRALAEGSGLLLRSFGQLFQHPEPPLELLRMVKEFAKRNLDQPGSALPSQIASALYYLSIAAALVRWGERISSLSDADLAEGFRWDRAQDSSQRIVVSAFFFVAKYICIEYTTRA